MEWGNKDLYEYNAYLKNRITELESLLERCEAELEDERERAQKAEAALEKWKEVAFKFYNKLAEGK